MNNQNCQKNQTAGNSDNQGIKEKVNQNYQTGKNPPQDSRPCGWDWLKAKLRLKADCGLWQLPQWEKLPVSHQSPLESELEPSR